MYDNSSSCSELCHCRLNDTVVCRSLPCTPSVACKHHNTVYGQHSSVMAALWNRARFCPVVSPFFYLSFRYLFSSPNFNRRCGLSANLGCRSETCCTRLAENTGCKKSLKIRHLGTLDNFGQLATKARINNRKKNLLNSNIFPTCPHNMVNFGPLTAEICWRVWGTVSYTHLTLPTILRV